MSGMLAGNSSQKSLTFSGAMALKRGMVRQEGTE